MSDSRNDIPLWNWYNGQLLFQFDEELKSNPNQSLQQFFQKFLISQNLENQHFYHTKNQGTITLLLYGLLVVSKELWEKNETNFRFETRNKFNEILIQENHKTTIDFLRLIRNAVSHANFSIETSNAKWKFWNNYNGNKNFEVEITHGDLGLFVAEIGKYYLNEVRKTQV